MADKSPSFTMLYKARDGEKNPEAWNLPLDTKVVADGEIDAHKKDGWLLAADVHAPKKSAKARPDA